MRNYLFSDYFYPSKNLKDTIKSFSIKYKGDADIVISPHAGYKYSGKTSALSISHLQKSQEYVLLGPSHNGIGEITISTEDWETPLGVVKNSEKTKEVLKEIGTENNSAHYQEHSLEIILPLMQNYLKKFKIIPINLNVQKKSKLEELSEILFKLKIPIVVSCDFSHYLSPENAKKNDYDAIDSLLKEKPDEFYKKVVEKKYSICGYQGVFVASLIAKKKKLKPELLEYTQSIGEKVVGYSSIIYKDYT